MRNVLLVSGVYIATLIGAGFASGQEIISFFVRYGKIGVLGVFLACVAFGVFAAVLLSGAAQRKVRNFEDYLSCVMPRGLCKAVHFLMIVFMMSVFTVMISGAGAAGHTVFGLAPVWGALLLCVLSLIVFTFDLRGMMAINSVLGGILVVGIFLSCYYILRYREGQVFASFDQLLQNWSVSAMSYVGYNVLTAGVILLDMSSFIRTKRQAAGVGVVSGICLFALMAVLWLVLNTYYGKIPLGEIPMLTLALRQKTLFATLYGVLLFLSIFTTAVSNGYGVIDGVKKIASTRIAAGFVISIGFLCSGFGFSTLIDHLYRACGILGIFIPAYFVVAEVKNMKKLKKRRKTEKIRGIEV